ncbi:alpha/beta hydrolase [Haloferula sp.]|uniref:alpha/beta hydrolase n=1 Tax=Haloferula sp. TaxID=2497595 RepID=UPI003C7158FC
MHSGLKTILSIFGWSLSLPVALGYDVPGYTPDQIIAFKQTVNSSGGAVSLNLDVFTPDGHQSSDSRPAIVFFFGGGWVSGSSSHFHPHCEYLASRGMVAISAEYRIRNTHGTTPEECVKDGKSAVRYIREHASELGIDPNRIAAGGGSAGGHIAAAAGTLTAYEEQGENLAISSRPNALVLFNPVIDNGPGGYGYSTVQSYWEDISPLENITASAPPTVFFLGTNDSLIPVATGKAYQTAMEAEGVRCDLHLYDGQPHSFFNFDVIGDSSGPFYGYQDTVFKTDEFLVSLGYLSDPHEDPVPVNGWVTIFGNAGFTGSSANTASPAMSDADADSIAANFDSVSLADGEFLRLTGSVSFNAALSSGSFSLGLFSSDAPVTPGVGAGFAGIWSSIPTTSATLIAKGDGSGSINPFETSSSTTLGPVPAADFTVAASTPVEFSLMIARNGNNLDVAVEFDDGDFYRSSQNLLNKTVSQYHFDSVAFLMNGNLNATQASFSNIAITSGRALPPPPAPPFEPPVTTTGEITYVDAVEGSGGNTFKTGSSPSDLSWRVVDQSGTDNNRWSKRTTVEGTNDTLFQAMPNGPATSIPELTVRMTGLADGIYDIYAFYWDQVVNDDQNWVLSAKIGSGALMTYSSPGEPAVNGATTDGVFQAGTLNFASPAPATNAGGGVRELFGINLGRVTVIGGSAVDVRVGMLLNGNSSTTRSWFDGVGYARVNSFSNWISGFNTGGMDEFDDDADADGIKNGVENFFGSNPSVANQAELIPRATSAGGSSFIFTHPQSPNSAEDVSALYEWSTTLGDFHGDGLSNDMGTTVNFSAETNTPTASITTVTASVSGETIPVNLFVRLRVSLSPP